MNNLLQTYDLTVGYGDKAVLSCLNLNIPEATMTLLVGANGAGKSTLLRTLSGAQRPLRGGVRIKGRDLNTFSTVEKARLVALVYTDRVGGEGLTVRELVSLGRQPYTGFFGRLSSADREIVDDAMASVGISHKAESFTDSLSDGERQKTMIARALAQQTPLLILDEPTAFLDVASRLEVIDLLGRLVVDEHKTILLSTHDLAPSIAAADRLWVIDAAAGTIVEGDKSELIKSGVMDRVFPDRPIVFSSERNDYITRKPLE